MQVPIALAPASSTPLHRQVYEEWRRGILIGRFAPGERVPSTRDLASALGISRTTVSAAYDQLAAEGYFESARGSGTFVCRDLPDDAARPDLVVDGDGASFAAVRLSEYGLRLEPGIRRAPAARGVINLSKSSPDIEHFPFRVWRRLIGRQLRRPAATMLGYSGAGSGHEQLRQEIASYLNRSRAVRCVPDQVIVVNGSQQALDLCARLLIEEKDEVAIENPGYQGARQLFAAHGARLRPIRVMPDGIAVEDLPRKTRLVYVTPSHQFPTGVSMSLARRIELLEWARAHNAAVIEDDYDSEYRYSGAPLPALQGLARGVAVIYLGTFSNVMFPGLRIGYVVVPAQLVEPFTRAKWHADRQTAYLEQAALADFFHEGHFDRHVRRMRRLYRRRRDALIEALAKHLGDRVVVSGEAAGMHAIVRFTNGAAAGRARRNGVHLQSTDSYYVSGAPPHEYIVRFSALDERNIREAVRRLATD